MVTSRFGCFSRPRSGVREIYDVNKLSWLMGSVLERWAIRIDR
jgi:hypothetical protein